MKRTFSITTLGCKVNQYESEAMSELFEEKGYMKVDQETEVADIYIINTCTVTNLSDRKSRQVIRKAKRENPEAIVAVVGCYSQVSPKEVASIEGVDIVLGTTERADIVNMVEDFQSNGQSINVVRSLDGDYEFQPINISKESDMTRAYMKVQDGCNRFCTYCIIPYARGRIRSRSIEDSVKEAKRLAEAGYKEIVLTGIHIGSYGKESGKNLIELIEEIAKVDGIERIRMSSVEPMTITEDFLKRAIATGKFCDHFHLSLQSGCDKVLKEMNRRYTTEEYKAVVDLIRKYMPKAGITTDIIVGFPGETDEEFEVTCKFVEEVEFSRIHVFKYSMRDGTPAAKRTDQVHGQVKHERSQKLIELNEKLMKKFASEQDTLDVLFEEEIDGKFVGYSTNYLRCSIESQDDLKNITKSVKIVSNESEPFEVVLS
ncbi:threonylcarbamoyladenosine tRNA methylthiotransferase MtaB [Peptoniphilus asaccharolyticus DSM 20463]|uniref:Threonylcarbamoyladenosine tRNA methylthiotransferase MtaB n=1 Tax=Peptoniphilus asaccharolyticus DSM 20463 TaxID=573058 RepID=A0A1W1UUM3_PEPAS|nr:tRNA (N(6)-L-threonylcarbamoyladenosine(37)-C(2))-methylthiotransferase MtaB [Peptoniphilus asaccharolyticus]MBL7575194.1 tRNA (N(6)-L-threonylcarbamoyladenosine(37)-C(2))-methylthiotransferase MtaB [Peptoniphilus asaccharolyticus]SMB84699.1 threonylcarbamoyladenosine tRNA methylthiotransferase MtaB [Peptoniphilus asaccharolyticus DSM 20463]